MLKEEAEEEGVNDAHQRALEECLVAVADVKRLRSLILAQRPDCAGVRAKVSLIEAAIRKLMAGPVPDASVEQPDALEEAWRERDSARAEIARLRSHIQAEEVDGCALCGGTGRCESVQEPCLACMEARKVLAQNVDPQAPDASGPFAAAINRFAAEVHRRSRDAGGWAMPEPSNTAWMTKVCLMYSRISEALEGHRKQMASRQYFLPFGDPGASKSPTADNHLSDFPPQPALQTERSMIEVALADAMIAIGDVAGALDLDLGGAIDDGMEYNRDYEEPDHASCERDK